MFDRNRHPGMISITVFDHFARRRARLWNSIEGKQISRLVIDERGVEMLHTMRTPVEVNAQLLHESQRAFGSPALVLGFGEVEPRGDCSLKLSQGQKSCPHLLVGSCGCLLIAERATEDASRLKNRKSEVDVAVP